MQESRRDAKLDALLKQGSAKRLPHDAMFACAYQVHFGVDYRNDAAFFRRSDGQDRAGEGGTGALTPLTALTAWRAANN